jgi:hypothetical protein
MGFYEDEDINHTAERVAVHQATNQANMIASQTKVLQYQMEEAEQNLAEAQLDCERTLSRIFHLLKQDVLRPNENGILDWEEIKDQKKRVLTDEGVDKIMQVLEGYINKETLLSNFDDKTIARRMLEFSLSFSGLMFMKYEIYYRIPTLQECQDILRKRIEEKIEKKKVSLLMLGNNHDEEKIRKIIYEELEPRIEYELGKIRQEQIKLNLREFEMIFTQLKALVEATHNRAWKGEERGSLRRHFNISEVIGGRPNENKPRNKGSWFGFGN